jgi:hypothetical protein
MNTWGIGPIEGKSMESLFVVTDFKGGRLHILCAGWQNAIALALDMQTKGWIGDLRTVEVLPDPVLVDSEAETGGMTSGDDYDET